MGLLFLLLMPSLTYLFCQYLIRDHCRCEICQRVTPYLTADGECVSCWEDGQPC